MDKLKRPKKLAFMALATLAIVLAVIGPNQAVAMGGHGFEGHGFDRHHDFDRVSGFIPEQLLLHEIGVHKEQV